MFLIIIVDTNIDVLLGLKDFKPRTIDEFTAPLHEMDEEGVLSYPHQRS
ncbi:hypothetical protein OK016_17870 [Vibrio chagasii]|nr:hypothetical protein [Vibrio chagasii]